MTVLDSLTNAVPQFRDTFAHVPAASDPSALWGILVRLLNAHAPSGGANLPGAIGGEIAAVAEQLGIGAQVIAQVGSTGNTAVAIGANKLAPDIVVVAHMDRPSFRVRSRETGELFPICANRFAEGEYRVPAKALRFAGGKLVAGARGTMSAHTRSEGTPSTLHFETDEGELQWHDTVLMDVVPTLENGTITGTGLDNCVGTTIALVSAAVLHTLDEVLRAHNRRCLFVFTDQEEGPPESFFGHGAARLTYAVPAPVLGCVVVDAQNAGPGLVPKVGAGVSTSAASNWGRGSIVPPNYHALAVDLARDINAERPDTVQVNTGYLSRSDDMILGRWARILALTGPPLLNAHTGEETARLSDVQNGVWWLSHILVAALGLVPDLAADYALGA